MRYRQLFLATIAFTISFSVWGLIAALAPRFKELYGLSDTQTALAVAIPVILGALLRIPIGILADRVGGARVLAGIFPLVAVLALLLISSNLVVFSVGALGIAALLGLGNGAVFKLVPAYFPTEVGTVTGQVGAIGGLGGFFPRSSWAC